MTRPRRFISYLTIMALSQPLLGSPLIPDTKPAVNTPVEDTRTYQHGIDFVPIPDGNYYLIWASSGNPPTGVKEDGNWSHDIYYAKIDPNHPDISPNLLISKPEAQEPSSTAITANGHIMVTMEDGWDTDNNVAQRYGVYDANLKPIRAYPRMAYDGGHSGHVAAVGNRFVLFYADDWVDGGGVDDLGTGNDVKAQIYNANGRLQAKLDIAVGDASRDWWPLVAGSKTRAALVWQRYVNKQTYSQLMLSIVDVKKKKLVVKALPIEEQVKYYTYSVTYLPNLQRFLIMGAYDKGGGFGYLLDQNGKITASNKTLPALVRESKTIIREQNGQIKAVQPTAPTGLMVLAITPDSINLTTTVTDDYAWQYSGTDGIFLDANNVYIVSTSPSGLVAKTFQLPDNH